MIYQVTANMLFAHKTDAKSFFQNCFKSLPKTTPINPGKPHKEFSVTQLIENNHDQKPNKPCRLIDSHSLP